MAENTTQLTPGPWGVPDEGTHEGRVRVSAGRPGEWNGMVADCDAGNYARSQSEGLANARLIAAAPDLLAAVREILGPLATIPMGKGGTPSEQVPQKANLRVSDASIQRARAAIARATRGEP